MRRFFVRVWKEQRGQDLVEYALLLFLTALAVAGSLKRVSNAVQSAYATASSTIAAGVRGGHSGDSGHGSDGDSREGGHGGP